MKQTAPHTPEPWFVRDGQEIVAKDGAGERLIAQCHAGHAPERAANAQVMAAAPRMLKALEIAVNALNPRESWDAELAHAAYREARRAIAKATYSD